MKSLKNAKAASLVEYGFLASLIAIVGIGGIVQFGNRNQASFTEVTETIESEVLSGFRSSGNSETGSVDGRFNDESVGAEICDPTFSMSAESFSYGVTDVHYAAGQWVAVGGNGTIVTSPDGGNWTLQTSNTAQGLGTITHDGSRWIAAGSNIILTSLDGVSWSQQIVGGSFSLIFLDSASIGGTTYLVVANGGSFYSSEDGVTWSVSSIPFASTSSVASNGSRIIVGGSTLDVFVSDDGGSSWVPQTIIDSGFTNGIHFNGTRWVAVGSSGIVYSDDGISWSSAVIPVDPSVTSFMDVTYDGRWWVAVGNGGLVLVSGDGVEWEQVPTAISNPISNVASNGTEFIAFGSVRSGPSVLLSFFAVCQ